MTISSFDRWLLSVGIVRCSLPFNGGKRPIEHSTSNVEPKKNAGAPRFHVKSYISQKRFRAVTIAAMDHEPFRICWTKTRLADGAPRDSIAPHPARIDGRLRTVGFQVAVALCSAPLAPDGAIHPSVRGRSPPKTKLARLAPRTPAEKVVVLLSHPLSRHRPGLLLHVLIFGRRTSPRAPGLRRGIPSRGRKLLFHPPRRPRAAGQAVGPVRKFGGRGERRPRKRRGFTRTGRRPGEDFWGRRTLTAWLGGIPVMLHASRHGGGFFLPSPRVDARGTASDFCAAVARRAPGVQFPAMRPGQGRRACASC